MTRVASIDIGSNSMHLCVADIAPTGDWKIVEVLRSSIQLGRVNPAAPKALEKQAMEDAIGALSGFSGRASLLHADHCVAAATAAIREADNQHEFVELFATQLGFPLRVLSGIEEAAIVYRGTRRHLEGHVLLFDLGGRSTELIWGSRSTPDVCLSIPMGHLGLKAHIPYEHPCSDEHWQELMDHARQCVSDIRDFNSSPHQLTSPSGAVRTLARMAACARGDSPEGRGEGLALHRQELDSLIAQLRATPTLHLSNIPGIDERRSETLLSSAAIVQALMQRFSKESIYAAPGGLREGLIQEWADGQKER